METVSAKKDGHVTPTRLVIYNDQLYENKILISANQHIKEPETIEQFVKSLDEFPEIERVLFTSVAVHKSNIDEIIDFFTRLKPKLK